MCILHEAITVQGRQGMAESCGNKFTSRQLSLINILEFVTSHRRRGYVDVGAQPHVRCSINLADWLCTD